MTQRQHSRVQQALAVKTRTPTACIQGEMAKDTDPQILSQGELKASETMSSHVPVNTHKNKSNVSTRIYFNKTHRYAMLKSY